MKLILKNILKKGYNIVRGSKFVKNIASVSSYCCATGLSSHTSTKRMSDFIYPNDQPIVLLDCEKAFQELTDKERLYAHHLSRAAWYGGLIVLTQTSLESPLIFLLLFKIFHSQPIDKLKEIAIKECNFSEDEFTALLVYTCGVFSNMGNYKGFGDSKFIPNLPKEKFQKFTMASKAGQSQPDVVKGLLEKCLGPMFSLEEKEKLLGFPYIGTTTYLSKNFTKEDSEIVKNFLTKQKIEPFNSRLIKTVDDTGNSCYEIRLASVLETNDEEEKNLLSAHTINGHKFVVTRGDYSKLLKLVNKHLSQAKEYAANQNESKMIENYIHSFKTGSLESHKEGSRYWVKDKGPIVETYIGFIETYRDPAGMRGEFEGFVAMVNKQMSAKFAELVNAALELLPLLPWPKTYEKDKFLQPDFTSLDVLTFSGSIIPAGICIPNYYEVKQNQGFKNVSLGNVISTRHKATSANFLTKEDEDLIEKHNIKSFEVLVGLHELLGHGSGKLFTKHKDGSFNFKPEEVVHLETNEKISTWYNEGENYDTIFGSFSSAYEECKAECVALHLSNVPEVLKIFGHEGTEAEEIVYVSWLEMCRKGLEGLQVYDPKNNAWLQAHCQARYVILQVLIEAGENFVKIEKIKGSDGNPDLLMTLDRSMINSVGKPAIAKFLKRLQLYKSIADATLAKQMFDKYSAVTSEDTFPFLDYREIVLARKKPKKMFVEANTVITDGKVELKNYDSSHEGMIQSWVERFENDDFEDILTELWKKNKPHFT